MRLSSLKHIQRATHRVITFSLLGLILCLFPAEVGYSAFKRLPPDCVARYKDLALKDAARRGDEFTPEELAKFSHWELFREQNRVAYNRAIERTIAKTIKRKQLIKRISKILDHYHELHPSFPQKNFESWLEKAIPPEDKFPALRNAISGRPMGEVVQRLFREFYPKAVAIREQEALAAGEKQLKDLLIPLIRQCDEDPQCLRTGLTRIWGPIKDSFANTCMGKDNAVLYGTLLDAALNVSLYYHRYMDQLEKAATQEKPGPETDGESEAPKASIHFEWGNFASAMLWTGVLNEVACHNVLTNGHEVGTHVERQVKAGSNAQAALAFLKERAKDFHSYWKYYLGLNVGSLAIYQLSDYYDQKAVTPERAATDYLFLTGYDLIPNFITKVMIWDPLLLKGFPLLQEYLKEELKSPGTALVVRNALEIPSRDLIKFYQAFLYTEVYNRFDEWRDEKIENVHQTLVEMKKTFLKAAEPMMEGPQEQPKKAQKKKKKQSGLIVH